MKQLIKNNLSINCLLKFTNLILGASWRIEELKQQLKQANQEIDSLNKTIDDLSIASSDGVPSKPRYRNLYLNHATNSYVYGINKHDSEEIAKENQQCPAGYVWVAAIPSRRWV